jgi:hypothetical protein
MQSRLVYRLLNRPYHHSLLSLFPPDIPRSLAMPHNYPDHFINILCEHKFSIGSCAEVFDAEAAAITYAIHYLDQHPFPAHNIYIFSDNSSAISTVAQASSGLILRHRQLLQPSIDCLRNQNRKIFLNWDSSP